MSIPQQFLDDLRNRTTLSALIGRSVKLQKAGREYKACCPFHHEATPSFTVNDEKGFAHCFGCGWHGDVFRWLKDMSGLDFIDAVKQLADGAGMEVPAPSPQAAERQARIETVRGALEAAQAIYARQLEAAGAVMEYLAGRGVTQADIAMFGIGFARGGDGSLRGSGIGQTVGREAGLLVEREAIGSRELVLREQFWDRITVPIHDHRGMLIGFGGRVWPGRRTSTISAAPKFINSPDSPLFDKGRTLFNLHRAAPFTRPSAENRLVIVEGYFDVVALGRAGVRAAVAPLGTALTETQLARAWRAHNRPTLLFDGDAAGQAAAVRACRTALPHLAAGREIAIGMLPDGKDPDDLLRELGLEAGAREIEAALLEARPLHDYLFDAVAGTSGERSPEQIAAVWAQLAELADGIGDDETRAQYLGVWRARFDREVSVVDVVAADQTLHAVRRADDGDYVFPESESDSARQLIQLVRALLRRRDERRQISEEIRDLMKMASAMGFVTSQITAVVRDIESDLAHGPGVREEAEMVRVLYRRTLGVRGPMNEAMLPSLVDGRPRQFGAGAKRRATTHALIDARAAEL